MKVINKSTISLILVIITQSFHLYIRYNMIKDWQYEYNPIILLDKWYNLPLTV